MSPLSEIYHSPPQTPQSNPVGKDPHQELSPSDFTTRALDQTSPEALFPSIDSSKNHTIMSSEQNSLQDTSSVPSIPNLSNDNWGTWYSAMESYFLIKDLDGILDKAELAPPDSDTTGPRVFLKRKKHFAGIIGLKLSDSIRELLVTDNNRRDPVALWRDIKAHFPPLRHITEGGSLPSYSHSRALTMTFWPSLPPSRKN